MNFTPVDSKTNRNVAGLSRTFLLTHRHPKKRNPHAGLVAAGAILLPAGMPRNPLVLALIVVALQFPTELFMTRNYGLALVFFTPLILLMTQLAYPIDPTTMLTDRTIETIGGALVGMAVAVTIRPRA